MENIIVVGGGGWGHGKKTKNNIHRERNEKGERKKGENCIKIGVKGLKLLLFWLYTLNISKLEMRVLETLFRMKCSSAA